MSAQTACLWLAHSTRHGLEELQRALLVIRYAVRNWKEISLQHAESMGVLRDFPEVLLQILQGVGSLLPLPPSASA